ncbi:MAG: hypothetical protein COZ77_10215 [Gallionellales bacterium CG_4_8_14_3_um_filter_54_18]|nr:MAG: hypothetical protein COW45_06380 [Gallionellales bacterium CG17_big_fil_post_rev_8_21_14_2_50_54_146]PIX03726.1 MAG: hypothetical protein COZ77_10215 [Gallionellales bacterium CG_4_8_14_3_um_filter_54_18]
MARTTSLTYEQIAGAADAITVRGERVTTRSVRDELGSGSMATVLRFLQDWRNRSNRQGQAVDEMLDLAVIKAINTHIGLRVRDATASASERNAELLTEIDGLLVENEKQASTIEEQAGNIESWKTSHAAVSARVGELENTVARLTEELLGERQTGEQARIALAKAELRLEAVPRFETEVAQLRAELLQSQKEAATYHEAAAVAQARLETSVVKK